LKLAFIKLNHSPLAVISTFNILLKSTHKKIRVFYNPIKDTYSFQYSIEINILRRLRDNGWKLDAIFQYSIEINIMHLAQIIEERSNEVRDVFQYSIEINA